VTIPPPSRSAVLLPGPLPLSVLAERYGGTADPDVHDTTVLRIAPLEHAGEGDLAPFLARRFLRTARQSRSVLLVDASLASLVPEGRRWVHPLAPFALAQLLSLAAPPAPPSARNRAHIDSAAWVDPTASIGPGVVILAGAVIGAGTRIEPNAVIYGGSAIGENVSIGAGAVIGRPGFGWTRSPDGTMARIPQLGGVTIDDGAEIGPLATIDSGTLGPTWIGRGAKLDAHVHVGHNVVIGDGAMVAAQAGFAGSVKVGKGVLVGGQAGVADHVTIGDGAQIGAKSGVIGDVPDGGVVAGYPAVERVRWLRSVARALGSQSAQERQGGTAGTRKRKRSD
jgi:UDP-3-O-[3-hydroxymyristoyl] glucosamine N-acyltransferase